MTRDERFPRPTPWRIATHLVAAVLLPPRVAVFWARARLRAIRRRDSWTLRAASKPREIRALLKAARGCTTAVEVGTGTAWTSIALALDDERRTVVSFDKHLRPQRDYYLALCPEDVRRRVTLVNSMAEDGAAQHDEPVDLLFLDGRHTCEATMSAFNAWRPRLAPGAVVAFHDWGNPNWPGVEEATIALGLDGAAVGELYIWHSPE